MLRIPAACVLVAFLLVPGTGVAGPEDLPPIAELQRLAELETQQAEILRAMLLSKDMRRVAWGAYESARRNARSLVPLLIVMAEERRPFGRPDLDQHARRSVLAALVDLEAKVPRALLLRLARGGTLGSDAAAILALENGSQHDWLALWDAAAKKTWGTPSQAHVALGNALATRHVAGFAARLLSALRLHLYLFVRDDKLEGRFGRPAGSLPGDGRFTVPVGYPPTVFHRVSRLPSDGSVLLAHGFRPMFHVRVEHEDRRVGFGVVSGIETWQESYREWLGLALRRFSWHARPEVLPLDTLRTLRWTTRRHFKAWAQRQFTAVHKEYWGLVARLIERGALTKEEAAKLQPWFEVHVKDERQAPRKLPAYDLGPPPNPYKTP